MKRYGCALLALLFLLGGCARQNMPEEITQLSQLEGAACGVVRSVWPDEAAQFAARSGGVSMTYADCADMNEAFFKLANKDVGCLLVPDFVASYLTLREPALGRIGGPASEHSVTMMLPTEQVALRDRINAALADMRTDGTLAALHTEWVTELYPFKVLEGEALTAAEGAEVLRVGLTAELEPLDFVTQDGMAGGYSARLLGELGERLGLSFQPVRVEAQEAISALASGEVDLLFAVEPGTAQQLLSSYAGLFTDAHFSYSALDYLVARDYTRLRGCTDMSRTNSRAEGSSSPFKEFTQ